MPPPHMHGAKPTPENRHDCMLQFDTHVVGPFMHLEAVGGKGGWGGRLVQSILVSGDIIPWGGSLTSNKKNEIYANTQCSIVWRGTWTSVAPMPRKAAALTN